MHKVEFMQSTKKPNMWQGKCSHAGCEFFVTGLRAPVVEAADEHEKQEPDWIEGDPRDPKWDAAEADAKKAKEARG